MSKVLMLIEAAKLPNGDRQWTQPPQNYYDAVLRTSIWGFPKGADYHVFTKFTFGLLDIIEAEALGFKIEYLGTGPYSFYSGAPEELAPAHQQATWSKTAQENLGTLYLNGVCVGFVTKIEFGKPL